MVRESLAEEIEKKLQNNPVCDYCLYLDNLENTVSLMTQSLGNLVSEQAKIQWP